MVLSRRLLVGNKEMAVTWDVQITVLDVATKAVSVAATRTDDSKPTEAKTYNVLYALIPTTAAKLAVLDNIWAQYQADKTRQAQIGAFIGALETDAKANLEAREA